MRMAFSAVAAVILAMSFVGSAQAANENPTYLIMEYATPADGQDAGYTAWVRNTQAPRFLKAPGMVSAQVYMLADAQNRTRQEGVKAAIPDPAKYLTIYTVQTADISKTLDALRKLPKDPAAPSLRVSYDFVERAITPVMPVTSAPNNETGALDDYILMVFANAKDGQDDTFNVEMNTEHAPGVAVNRAFGEWRRYTLNDAQLGPTANNKFLVVYRIKTASLQGVWDSMRQRRLDRPTPFGLPKDSVYDNKSDYSESYKALK